MRRFTQLFLELDASNQTGDKVRALRDYFREAPPEDAVWTLWFLIGRRFPVLVGSGRLREWAATLAGLPEWLLADCYERVGDTAETISLLLPEPDPLGLDEPLHTVVADRLLALRDWDEAVQFQLLRETWARLSRPQIFVFNKMLTGGFRVGVSRNLVVRALAEATGLDRGTLTHRLMGEWQPAPEFFRQLTSPGATDGDASRPYPFYLASPLPGQSAAELGDLADWQVEWKWDGIRAQLIKRHGQLYLWSRGEELVTERFPEVIQAAARLPNGTVLDGELLAWRAGQPLGFNALQTRITRQRVTEAIQRTNPVAFIAYDCLEAGGRDLRSTPLRQRRRQLEAILAAAHRPERLLPSPLVDAPDWAALKTRWLESRSRGVEGLMLKGKDSTYEAGRVRGQWWKWKIAPYTADLVLIYAQAGSGRRASIYSDYTLAAWQGDTLVPVAKAYSGLSDAELREVDRWIKANTRAKRGPVRTVPGELVFEIAFEGIRTSARHRGGVACRFPRILRWRRDKPAAEADHVATLLELAAAERDALAPQQAEWDTEG